MALALLSSCSMLEHDVPQPAEKAAPSGKVKLSFKVAVPGGPETKAMGNRPLIDNMYVAVFGGSGFYNEWVQAEIENANENNYDPTHPDDNIYTVNVTLTMSDSRLRLHFIANCPERFKTNPPITGISAQDLEDVVMGKVRSTITDSYNDSYWQKVILPHGVKAKMKDVVDEHGNVSEVYDTDELGNYLASDETTEQFPNPIPLVRNFARIYLRNLTNDVTIAKYGLVFAPAEGPVAPIVSEAYPTDVNGDLILTNLDNYEGKIYYENFIRNYQNYPLLSDNTSVRKVTDSPFNYGGYSPDDVVFGSYPDPNDPDPYTPDPDNPDKKDPNYPTLDEMLTWDPTINNSTGLQAPLFMYERQIPTTEHRATRVMIYAHKDGENDANNNPLYKYYALDIVDDENGYIPILRNQTYTVKLIGIELGSGETDLEAAAGSSSATVSGDPATQYVTEINDGSASISASYTEMLYVTPGTYDVFFRYVPTYAGENAGVENNDLVTYDVGIKNESTGSFTKIDAANATSSVFQINNGEYAVNIEKVNDKVVLYARKGSGFTSEASVVNAASEKWGRIVYTTIGTDSDGFMDEHRYFAQGVVRNAAIRITGTYENHTIFRDVLVKISPRKTMYVKCMQPYVEEKVGESEVVRVYIPTDLPRAVFPLQFKIEAGSKSLTPNGDVLPVDTGASIIPQVTGPSYHFIKNITREDYVALSEQSYQGSNWKYFDCNFKTTMATSASNVYVKNLYFDDAHDNDRFYNHTQRLFTGYKFNTGNNKPLREGTPVEYDFTMDEAHGSNTVWWDISTDDKRTASLSTSNKVLPLAMLVTLQNLTPAINENTGRPEDAFTSGNDYDDDLNDDINYYILNIGGANTTASASLANATLHLQAKNAGACSVTLSTLNITENPYLYKEVTTTGTVQALNFSISPTTATVRVGGTTTLSYTATPAYSGDVVEWSSSDTNIATVEGNGVVRGVARGTATITATLAGKEATCQVTVRNVKVFNTTKNEISSTGTVTLQDSPISVSLNVRDRYQYNNYSYVQLNRNAQNIIQVSASGSAKITQIVLNLNNSTSGNITCSTTGYTSNGTTGTWTGNASSVSFHHNSNNTTRLQIKSIEVYYDE